MFKILNNIYGYGNRFPILTSRNFSHHKGLLKDYNKLSENKLKKQEKTIGKFKEVWQINHMNLMKKYKIYINNMIQQYDNNMNNVEKRFPKMKIMRVFNTGLKDIYQDIKKYISIKKKKKLNGIQSLTRDEIELNFKLPRDLLKVSPVLIISAIPFTNYIVFPLIYFFPRVFLVSYFWTIQQRLDYFLYNYKRKLKYNKPVLRCLQAQKREISQLHRIRWNGIIASLGSGTHPTISDLIACKELFKGHPFSLNSLKRNHINELLGLHTMSRWMPFRRKRLLNRGLLIKSMDIAIQKEGGVTKIPIEALKWVVSFRGLNPVNMSTESMQEWLDQWLIISSEVDKTSISLLLHCPVLLAYNHPTNWTLLYRKV
ncbi:LETM1 domain-containing protein 1 isoform X1 [Leptopilina boulardi]|uniref:LETM1 domain-containing protein 1 isoform X1 n=2 Tax=Leptopilina boulardi TaxID=63433 RepID=UPI0021F67BFC|nr:LETM1 domain-containing protein 1 isoform X1 [Leptopilina boulardi]